MPGKNQDLFELNKIMRRAQGPQRPVTAGNSQVRGAGGPPPNPQRPQPGVRRPASSSGQTGPGAGRPRGTVGFDQRATPMGGGGGIQQPVVSGGRFPTQTGQQPQRPGQTQRGQGGYAGGRQRPGPFIPGQTPGGRGNPIPGGGIGGGAQLPPPTRGPQGPSAPPPPTRGPQGPMIPPQNPQRAGIPTAPGQGPAGGGFGGGYRGGPVGTTPGPTPQDEQKPGLNYAQGAQQDQNYGAAQQGQIPNKPGVDYARGVQSYVNPALGNVQTGPDGRPRVTLNEQGRQAYQRAYDATKRNYGNWPGRENPMSPQPKIIPGEPNFNPFNPNGWIE